MIRTLLGIRSIAILAIIATVVIAYASDRASSGDTFAVGEVDITLGNESYYNGSANPNTSWDLRNLTVEKFFNFTDVKPGDYGEDTISLHVDLEDTYLCADVTLTSNNENGCNEPEGLVDGTCNNPGPDEGELADLIEFMWWADDGDNVFESDENIISQGPIGALTLNEPLTLALADTDTNIWTGAQGALLEGSTQHIGKAWCYGELTPQALTQDGDDNAWSPADDNDSSGTGGEPTDGGFTCMGNTLGNESQTDSLSLDVAFNAAQAFGNDGYLCSDGVPPEPPPIPDGVGLPFYEGFGNGTTDDTFDEEDNNIWEEGGTAGAAKSGPSGSEESSAPDGNRFARMRGGDGWICIAVDATGYETLDLQYEWRGDDQATSGDVGYTQYATGGTCASPTGLTTLQTHDMTFTDNPPWVTHNEDISALDNSVFYLIFLADTAGAGVDFRIDGVYVTGAPI